MTVNVEALLIAALNAVTTLPEAFPDVPGTRPAAFITVERVGGGYADVRDLPMVAVQCWAGSRFEASELAGVVAGELRNLAHVHPQVGRVGIESVVNFPDPDSKQARYQVTATLVTKK